MYDRPQSVQLADWLGGFPSKCDITCFNLLYYSIPLLLLFFILYFDFSLSFNYTNHIYNIPVAVVVAFDFKQWNQNSLCKIPFEKCLCDCKLHWRELLKCFWLYFIEALLLFFFSCALHAFRASFIYSSYMYVHL